MTLYEDCLPYKKSVDKPVLMESSCLQQKNFQDSLFSIGIPLAKFMVVLSIMLYRKCSLIGSTLTKLTWYDMMKLPQNN